MSRSCTMVEAESFARAAVPGHVLTYFIAENASSYDGLDRTLHDRPNPTLIVVVDRIRRLANEGHVDLVQKRTGTKTQYLAIWRKHVEPIPFVCRFPMVMG